jgi:hypothetical protein
LSRRVAFAEHDRHARNEHRNDSDWLQLARGEYQNVEHDDGNEQNGKDNVGTFHLFLLLEIYNYMLEIRNNYTPVK